MHAILERREIATAYSYSRPSLNSTQIQTDQLLNSFVSESSNPYALAGMLAGGFAYRSVKLGVFSVATKLLGSPNSFLATLGTKAFAISIGFGAEVCAFEGTQRTLMVKWGGGDASLLKWSGENGIQNGLVHSAFNLGALKIGGNVGRGHNIFMQHSISDVAMLLSHRFQGFVDHSPSSQKTLVEEFVFAEAMQLQMMASASLLSQGHFAYSHMEEAMEIAIERQFPNLALNPALRGEAPIAFSAEPSYRTGQNRFYDTPSEVLPDVFQLGQTLKGRYQITSELGKGGMGVVYTALDNNLGSIVVVKALRPEYAADKEARGRFTREARIQSKAQNPHVAHVTDVGVEGDIHFIVMEYLEGKTLSSVIEGNNRGISQHDILVIAAQIAKALKSIHEAGIVHRDLKPDNIFLLEDNFVKILDFGIAKMSYNDPAIASQSPAPSSLRHTKVGQVFGTPHYMSPEQAQGQEVGPQSDIYSLGVMLYELATGRHPYSESQATAESLLIAQIIKPPPPFSKWGITHLSPTFSEFVLKCMQKDLSSRFQSIEEVSTAISALQSELPHSGRARSTIYWGAGAAALVIGILGAGFMVGRKKEKILTADATTPDVSTSKVQPIVSGDAALKTKKIVLSVTQSPAEFFIVNDSGEETLIGTGASVSLKINEDEKARILVKKEGYKSKDISINDSTEVSLDPITPAKPAPSYAKSNPYPSQGVKPNRVPTASNSGRDMKNPFLKNP